MDFKDKYTIECEKTKPKNKEKNVISDDAFAVGEVIDELINKIEQVRKVVIQK